MKGTKKPKKHPHTTRIESRFDEFLWRLKTIAGRLGMQRLSLWARAWWRWRTNYEPFGRRRSRGGPPDGPFAGEGEDEGDFF